METVSEILDAIRTLPRTERVRLAQELSRELGVSHGTEPARSEAAASAEFDAWLEELLRHVPTSPPVPPEAFDRGSIYDE